MYQDFSKFSISDHKNILGIIGIAGIFIFILAGVAGLRVVPEGNTGVEIEQGKAVGELEPGWHWVLPVYQDVKTLSFRTETYTMSSSQSSTTIENDARSEDALSVKTREGLNSQMDVSIRYRMERDKAQEVYTQLGMTEAIVRKLIRPTAREEIRTAASRFSINEIYSENRSDFRAAVEDDIRNDFEEYGFIVQKVQIRNIRLPERVENAIEAKESVEQEIEKKQKEVEREKLEKERKIVEAEGDAEQNEILDRSLTKKVLVNRYINALESGDVRVAYIPIGESGTPSFVENLNDGSKINSTN
jgi:regulator of protease activity HflC (stomatin/prohibitin superfamily)